MVGVGSAPRKGRDAVGVGETAPPTVPNRYLYAGLGSSSDSFTYSGANETLTTKIRGGAS